MKFTIQTSIRNTSFDHNRVINKIILLIKVIVSQLVILNADRSINRDK